MNKKIFIMICVLTASLTLSGCGLLNKDENQETAKDSKTESAESNTKQDNDGDGTYFETLSDLMARGKSMKCTYTQEVEGSGTATGVVYMADKNARVEITIGKGKMYSITDHKWSYSWTDSSSNGYKMTLEASEMSEKNKETISNMSKEIDFECKKWRKDTSKFKVPSDIAFEDMTEMMAGFEDIDLAEEIKNAEAQSKEFLCNHCKTAPTPELVAECLGDVVCD